MGKNTVETFVQSGIADWYLRIPLTKPPGTSCNLYLPQYFWTEYLPKDKFTLRQALARRLEMVKDAEEKGLRKSSKGKNGFQSRMKTSATFEKEEADGLYDKYNTL